MVPLSPSLSLVDTEVVKRSGDLLIPTSSLLNEGKVFLGFPYWDSERRERF